MQGPCEGSDTGTQEPKSHVRRGGCPAEARGDGQPRHQVGWDQNTALGEKWKKSSKKSHGRSLNVQIEDTLIKLQNDCLLTGKWINVVFVPLSTSPESG